MLNGVASEKGVGIVVHDELAGVKSKIGHFSRPFWAPCRDNPAHWLAIDSIAFAINACPFSFAIARADNISCF